MIRTLLCYGDSNTHGTMPMAQLEDLGRFAPDVRWPGVLAAELGPGWRVIEEGHPGRTTVHPDPVSGVHKNGLAILPAVLESHRPIDLVALMLGTNDMKARFQVPPVEIATSIEKLVLAIRQSFCGPDAGAPAVLVVCPPPVLETGLPRGDLRGRGRALGAACRVPRADGAAAGRGVSRRGRRDRVEPARRCALRRRRARQARPGGGRRGARDGTVGEDRRC